MKGQQGPSGPQQVTPDPPAPKPKSSTPAGTKGTAKASVPPAATPAPLPPQKHLLEVPEHQRGKQWHDRMNKPFTPWEPTQVQLWEAHRLFKGESEWATAKATYLPSSAAKGAPSMRYLCGADSCRHLSASVLDARGHYQANHLDGLTSLPCVPAGTTLSKMLPPWPTTWMCSTMHIQGQS